MSIDLSANYGPDEYFAFVETLDTFGALGNPSWLADLLASRFQHGLLQPKDPNDAKKKSKSH